MAEGNLTRGRAATGEQEQLQWGGNSTATQANESSEGLRKPMSPKRPRRSLLSRKSIWFLVLALGAAFVLKQYGRQLGLDSSSASKLIEAVSKLREKKDEDQDPDANPEKDEYEDVGAHPVANETEDNEGPTEDSSTEDDGSEASHFAYDVPRDTGFETLGDSDEETTGENEQCPAATLLKSASPMFTRPKKKFKEPKTSLEKWTNNSAELVELLVEKAGPEAAEAFVTLLSKQLPSEHSIVRSTHNLSTQVMEIRKQKMARLANTCFQYRRQREVAYATYLIMEQHFQSLKKHFLTNEKLPESLAKAYEAFQGDVDMAKEEEQLASTKAHYESMLVKESTSLQLLLHHLTTFSGHTAAVEAIQKLDELGTQWKSKVSRDSSVDAGSLLSEAVSGNISEIPSIGAITPLAAAVTSARAQVFEAQNAAFKCVAKFAQIVKTRKAITHNFAVAQDPELEGLTPPMVQNAVLEAYEMMDKVNDLQAELITLLKSRGGKVPVIEPWLALIL